MLPKEPVTVSPNDVAFFKVRFRNTGDKAWPSSTSLYQIDFSKYSAFNDDTISFNVGDCKSTTFKQLEMAICAPSEPGTFSYEFQMGTDVENLFGEVAKIILIVEEEEDAQEEEPEVKQQEEPVAV